MSAEQTPACWPRSSRHERTLLGSALFLGLFAIYFWSPVVVLNDSWYTMLVSEHFLLTGDLAVDEHFSPHVDSSDYPHVMEGQTLPHHIMRYQGSLYYMYPAGTPVLSAPFVFLMRLFLDESVFDEDGAYQARAGTMMARLISARGEYHAVGRRPHSPIHFRRDGLLPIDPVWCGKVGHVPRQNGLRSSIRCEQSANNYLPNTG